MPLKRQVFSTPPASVALRQELIDEWRSPNAQKAEPVIIEQSAAPNVPVTHLYVIWEKWRSLSQQERSEIIMDSFEDIRGSAAALNVTVAMGLTADEAKRMNISA